MANKKQISYRIDWERLEPRWRAGIKSVLQLAAEYEKETGQSVSHTAINKHFKKLGVPRDLKAKIQAKADALVSAAQVSARVSTETTITDAQIVNEVAKDVAAIRLSHRKDINRVRNLLLVMLGELESITSDNGLFLALGDMLARPGENGIDRLNELYMKVVGIPSRVDSIKKISDTLKTLITLEREAYGLQTDDGAGSSVPAGLGHFYGQ